MNLQTDNDMKRVLLFFSLMLLSVSYTHLDVYKRQLYNRYQEEVLSKGQGRLADIDSHNKAINGLMKSANQLYLSLIHIFVINGRNFSTTWWFIFLSFVRNLKSASVVGNSLYPVSYTHLDVYKRQLCRLLLLS